MYIPSVNHSKTDIKGISLPGSFKKTVKDGTNLIIACSSPQDKIEIEYELTLEKHGQTLSDSNGKILLTNFLVTPAVYRNGAPVMTYVSSFGDPYIYDLNNYEISIKMDRNMNIFAPGETGEVIAGDRRVARFKAVNVRDFPAVLESGAEVATERHGGTSVYYIDSLGAREFVNHAFDFAENSIGPYPYKEFYVVRAPISNKGMEFSNMIFLSDECFKNTDTLRRVAYHEVFHQWFYGIIGTDQLNEPFLDEGLVNYLSVMLCNDSLPAAYNDRFFGMRLCDYKTREEYVDLAYNNATLYFNALHKALGDNFISLLKKLYNEKKFSRLYFDDFKKYADQAMSNR